MQTLSIDLKKNADVASIVAGLEPGTELNLKGTIKSLDEQTLTVTLDEVEAPESSAKEEETEKPKAMVPDMDTEADDEERV